MTFRPSFRHGRAPDETTAQRHLPRQAHLCRLRTPPFVPTEVHLVTTREGGQHLELTLLHPDQGRFGRFLADFGLEGRIEFDSRHIHILHDGAGVALDDIRSDTDNTAAADAITSLVGRFTADAT